MTDGTVMWCRLAADAAAGSTILDLDRAGGLLDTLPRQGILVDVGNNHFDWHIITPSDVSGSRITLSDRVLDYGHGADSLVGVFTTREPMRATWLGCVYGSASGDATRNTAALNRIASNALSGGLADITHPTLALDGAFYINSVIKSLGATCKIKGWSGDFRRDGLIAHSSFPFDGDMPMIGTQEFSSAEYNSYLGTRHDISGYYSDFFLDGNGLADSIGMCQVPQQPGYSERMLFKRFRGPTAYFWGGQNCYECSDIYGEDNFSTMIAWQTIGTIRNLHVVAPAQVAGVSHAADISGESITVTGLYVYEHDASGASVTVDGNSAMISGFYHDAFGGLAGTMIEVEHIGWPPSGEASYHFRGHYGSPVHANTKVIRDIGRNFSLKDADLYGHGFNIHTTHALASVYKDEATYAQSGVPRAA